MFSLRQARVGTIVIAVTAVFLICLFSRTVFFLSGLNYLRAGGPLYTQSKNLWGITADTLPPKLNLTEALLIIELMHENATEKEKQVLKKELLQLEENFEAARAYWKKQALPPNIIKILDDEVVAEGEKMLEAIHGRFLPALENGNLDKIHAALARVESQYKTHQNAIKRLDEVSSSGLKHEEEISNTKIHAYVVSAYMILILSTLLIFMGAWALIYFIARPLKSVTETIVSLSEGNNDIKIKDEDAIGDGEIPRLWRAVIELKKNVSQSKQAKKILEDNEQYLTTIMNTVVESIVSIDSHGCIRSFNHSAENLFGYKAEEVIGKNISVLMPEPYASHHDGYVRDYLTTGHAKVIGRRRELTALRKNGDTFPIDLEVNDTQIGGEKMFVGSIRDISDRRQAENDRLARERAEASNKAKSEFLANMSHELRTPMHAILSYSQMALKKLEASGDENLKKFLGNIRISGNRLLSLLNNLLDLSKLEAGKIDLEIQPGNLHQAMDHSLTELNSLIGGKKLQVKITGAEAADATVIPHDKGLLIQVFINLLSNAIKFSPPENVIDIHYTHTGSALVCSVTNRGTTIPERELEAIFDAFTQSSTTKTGAGGTGLGLSICRQIIQAHHGKIWAENCPDGVVFHVHIPLKQPAQENGDPGAAAESKRTA
ncbi:MAG: PAS domain-containing sensor histidine kinase [Alphaproteobacteria bacterium]|nr:PAS domain-containing sensor histidine kinase [Alphaproteobacteria bacterium]